MIANRTAIVAGFAALLACTTPSPAESEKSPTVLTVQKRGGERIDLTMADIEALPHTTYVTTTPWHDGAVRFEGVSMKALLGRAGISGETIRVEALNGYKTKFPTEDALSKPVIMAFKRNGNYMSPREKGPLFIVYNYDSNTELQTERYHTRSAWQVRSIVEE